MSVGNPSRHASRMPLFRDAWRERRLSSETLRCGDCRRSRGRLVGRLFPHPRSRLCRLDRGDRARPDLCARRHHAVGRLDPPAVLHAREHPHEPVRRRVLPRPEGAVRPGGRHRLSRARLSAARERDRRGDACGEPRRAARRRCRHRAAGPSALADKFPWLNGLGPDARRLRAQPAKAGSTPIRCSRSCATRRAQKGARYIHGEVVGIERAGARITGVRSPTARASPAARWSMPPGRRPATSRRSPASRCRSSRASAACSWSRAAPRCPACR